MPRPKLSVPTYRHHKPSGRARVTINGRDIWLGKWNTPESRAEYARVIADLEANGSVRAVRCVTACKDIVCGHSRCTSSSLADSRISARIKTYTESYSE